MELTEKMSLFLGSQFRYNAVRLGTCDQGPDAGRFEIIREIAMVLSPMCRRGFFYTSTFENANFPSFSDPMVNLMFL